MPWCIAILRTFLNNKKYLHVSMNPPPQKKRKDWKATNMNKTAYNAFVFNFLHTLWALKGSISMAGTYWRPCKIIASCSLEDCSWECVVFALGHVGSYTCRATVYVVSDRHRDLYICIGLLNWTATWMEFKWTVLFVKKQIHDEHQRYKIVKKKQNTAPFRLLQEC